MNSISTPAKATESLGYVCKATVQRHGSKGYVYRNRWPTGAQDLVFLTHESARKWIAGKNGTYQGPL